MLKNHMENYIYIIYLKIKTGDPMVLYLCSDADDDGDCVGGI